MDWIIPNWPAPARVKAISTTRSGGVSQSPFDALNLGDHVGDKSEDVAQNRHQLLTVAPQAPCWLNQVHGTRVINLAHWVEGETPDADAAYSAQAEKVCVVMTADCLPVLFCSTDGSEVGAAHAGWRGLAGGVLEATVAEFSAPNDQIMAWLGPAIGPSQFEVGGEVREAFIAQHSQASAAFVEHGDKWLADIYHLARIRLNAMGIEQVYGGDQCTVSDPARFFSYRRDKDTGRQASLIWIES
uniref:purine nucleoside phosphorylase YfiH n=1 Tax=Thaumasiovibrio occultus TaxID=1891184 RepID=UPI000B34CE42|nr:purine nucleoside phosphorylase YfiH [Thaumasiovibrio occultus]